MRGFAPIAHSVLDFKAMGLRRKMARLITNLVMSVMSGLRQRSKDGKISDQESCHDSYDEAMGLTLTPIIYHPTKVIFVPME